MRKLVFIEQLIREGEMIVAYCPELDVSSCGYTVPEARNNLQTALRLFLEEASRMDTLRDILLEAGYDLGRETLPSPTISIGTQEMSLEREIAQCLA